MDEFGSGPKMPILDFTVVHRYANAIYLTFRIAWKFDTFGKYRDLKRNLFIADCDLEFVSKYPHTQLIIIQ